MRRIAFTTLLFLASTSFAVSADSKGTSEVLKATSELMRSRKYKEAQEMIARALENDRNSHKLWLAMGYVLEADGQFEKALKAFYQARDLNERIEGLPERIIRLENLLKNTAADYPDKQKAEAVASLARARYYVETKSTRKGLIEFVKAVNLDRSILGSERKLIELGLSFFANPDNLLTTEDRTYYLGVFSFFAGNYSDAARDLNTYVTSYPTGSEVAAARTRLEEIATLESQLQAMEKKPDPKPETPVTPKQPTETKPADKKPVVTAPVLTGEEELAPAYVAPTQTDEYASLNSEQLYSEAMAIAAQRPLKAIGILGRAIRSGKAQPECYQSLADLYASRKGFEKEAISTYREVMEKFPGTPMAAEAKQKILQMSPSPEQRAKEVSDYFSNQ